MLGAGAEYSGAEKGKLRILLWRMERPLRRVRWFIAVDTSAIMEEEQNRRGRLSTYLITCPILQQTFIACLARGG